MVRSLARSASAALVVAALAAIAACGPSEPAVASDLARDLDAVRATAVDLAPRADQRTLVVSAEEQTGAAPTRVATTPRRAAPQRAVARPRAAARTVAAAPAPRPAAPDPVPAPAPASRDPEPVITGPLRREPAPAPTPEPPGGWRSTGEVIRDAPFPVKP